MALRGAPAYSLLGRSAACASATIALPTPTRRSGVRAEIHNALSPEFSPWRLQYALGDGGVHSHEVHEKMRDARPKNIANKL